MNLTALMQELKCSLCRDFYKTPVTLPCGHSFCQECIQRSWMRPEPSTPFCPECRETFPMNVKLNSNSKMRNLVKHITSQQTQTEVSKYICCYCVGKQNTDVKKMCLVCDAFLCDIHLKTSCKTEDHVLMDTTASLDRRKCPVHQEYLKYYCLDDCTCICPSCIILGDHRQHKVTLVTNILEEQKDDLQRVINQLKSKEKEMQEICHQTRRHRKDNKAKSARSKKKMRKMFSAIRTQLKVVELQVLGEITRQNKEDADRFSDRIKKLKQRKSAISKKIADIQGLCNSLDPLAILENKSNELNSAKTYDITDIPCLGGLDDVLVMVNFQFALNRFQHELTTIQQENGLWGEITSNRLKDIDRFPGRSISEDQFNAFRLDPGGRKHKSYRLHQVVSSSAISSGRYYWQVEIDDLPCWGLGVSYDRIITDDVSLLGFNSYSWCLYKPMLGNVQAVHNCQEFPVQVDSPIDRIVVYLDYEKGDLSFCQISSNIRHLHTFSTTFQNLLHPVLFVALDNEQK
uniref:TRIM protein 50 n=1 Tax=Xenopus laevis TaxID=8355 RepID=A0A9Y2DY75_XENLA|nr:TRIM protein 50 [Xenopus laevis]